MKSLKTVGLWLWIELVRLSDHGWRELRGIPRISRSRITAQIFLGGQYNLRGLKKIQEWGITGIVNMREKPFTRINQFPTIKYLHLPTKEHTAPSLVDLKTGVQFIQQQVDKGGKIYIHCRWGEGRGPTMVVAYLISTGMSLMQAISQVQTVRPFIRMSQVQLDQLVEFETSLDNRNKGR